MPPSAYLSALQWLSRRELSEFQVRQRLARRGYESQDIDEAVDRLKADRSLDDARVAGAIARTEVTHRGRGRLRVKRRIEAAGIASALTERALEDAFAEVDVDTLLTNMLDKRLRGRTEIESDQEFRRLYRYLTGQGFESDRVVALLRSRRGRPI